MPERRDEVVLPPPPQTAPKAPPKSSQRSGRKSASGSGSAAAPAPGAAPAKAAKRAPARPTASTPSRPAGRPPTGRRATLRLVQVEPWSVMKTAFLLSIAMGIVTIVAVAVVWGVLGAAGLWDSVNTVVQESLGDTSGAPFDVRDYLGTSRVLGFTMIVAVADVILITAIATLAAFLYNLAATLLGGIQLTFTEDK